MASGSYFIRNSLFINKNIFFLVYVNFVQYSNVTQRTFEIVQKSRSHEHTCQPPNAVSLDRCLQIPLIFPFP